MQKSGKLFMLTLLSALMHCVNSVHAQTVVCDMYRMDMDNKGVNESGEFDRSRSITPDEDVIWTFEFQNNQCIVQDSYEGRLVVSPDWVYCTHRVLSSPNDTLWGAKVTDYDDQISLELNRITGFGTRRSVEKTKTDSPMWVEKVWVHNFKNCQAAKARF